MSQGVLAVVVRFAEPYQDASGLRKNLIHLSDLMVFLPGAALIDAESIDPELTRLGGMSDVAERLR
jgi:hypothetical protein